MSEKRRKSKNPARRAAAITAVSVAGLIGAGVGYSEMDRRHTNPTEFVHEYGEEEYYDRHSVTSEYLEKLKSGERVEAIKGAVLRIDITVDGEQQTLSVNDPIEMYGDVEGNRQVVGYLGLIQQADRPQGYVAIFASKDTKLEAGDPSELDKDVRLEFSARPQVDAYVPADPSSSYRGFEYEFHGTADDAVLQAGVSDVMLGGYTPNTLGNAVNNMEKVVISGSDDIRGNQSGTATAKQ